MPGTFKVNDQVILLEPFNVPFPGTFKVLRVNPDGVCGIYLGEGKMEPDYPGVDFEPVFLQKVGS